MKFYIHKILQKITSNRDQKLVEIGRLHHVFRCDNNELGSACVSPAGDGESPEKQPGGDQGVEDVRGHGHVLGHGAVVHDDGAEAGVLRRR